MPNERPVPYSPEQAAAMRQAFRLWNKWGVKTPELARKIDVEPRTIANFLNADREPAHKTWCLYYRYAYNELNTVTNPEMVALLMRATGQYGNTALSALAGVVPDIFHYTKSVTPYAGKYLTYSAGYIRNFINVTWMHIFYDADCHALRFEQRFRTRQEILRQAVGYIVPTERTLNLIGCIDQTGHLTMGIINRHAAPEWPFRFLHGILLSVDSNANQFATKILLRPLPEVATIDEHDHNIRLMSLSEKRIEHETADAFEKRQHSLSEIRAIKGLLESINNETPPGSALQLLRR